VPDRDISCSKCGCNLGTIRDARLRKDIVYYCGTCDAGNAFAKGGTYRKKEDFSNAFGDIFGDMFGKSRK